MQVEGVILRVGWCWEAGWFALVVFGYLGQTQTLKRENKVAQSNAWNAPVQNPCACIRGNDSPARSSPKDVLAEEGPKNDSRSRASGTGLTMNRRPAECTTCAATLGGRPADKSGLKGGKK